MWVCVVSVESVEETAFHVVVAVVFADVLCSDTFWTP